ncbi:beta-lactamase class D [Crossiella equi]|uniref:Beta-lactamase class D n=1 Tax=Crossiella equi TaxID=130796 RepID=A0ABS5A833_9PSEU|nr:penicillin-binding transpeptidase domain-containing protein [Crossiella equi]MBP2472744.1 beta-lactamase class D [Crossiella equi]
MLSGGAAALAVAVGAGVVALWPEAEKPPTPPAGTAGRAPTTAVTAAKGFLTAFADNDPAAAAGFTDRRAEAEPVLRAQRQPAEVGNRPDKVVLRRDNTPEPPAGATEHVVGFGLRWEFGQGAVWEYEHKLTLRRTGGQWAVVWAPETIHPQFTAGRTLRLTRGSQDAEILGADGKPLPEGNFSPAVLPAVRRALAGGLKGEASWKLVMADAAGAEVATVAGRQGKAGENARLTLSPAVQSSAQKAVDSVQLPASLVAIRANGEILAVAQNAAADATPGGLPALSGRYAPGSTFKIATASAVLQAGRADANTVLPCPGQTTVKQRQVRNDDRFDLGEVPLHRAFARSCNTTFAQLGAELPASALTDAARQLGIGVDFDIQGLTTNTGKVPEPRSAAAQVEASFGQGEVLVSPFGLAVAAATVAGGGRMPTPFLVRGSKTGVTGKAGTIPPAVAGQLRSMMREVVTGGTAHGLPGATSGKTGTAQFGDGSSAHGWFAGFRGDVGFAVFVENAGSSRPAVDVTGRFLRGFQP